MTTAAKDLVLRAANILKDELGIRWPADELVRWLNDAQMALAQYRPDQVAQTRDMVLGGVIDATVSNPINLDADVIKLIDVVTANGRAVRQVDRKDMDAVAPDWRTDWVDDENDIKHFVYDERNPASFEIWPLPYTSARLTVEVAVYPTPVPTDVDPPDGDIGVPDIWAPALVDYMLYRAFSKDSEITVNAARATGFYQSFANAIGIDLAAQTTVAPKPRSPGKAAAS